MHSNMQFLVWVNWRTLCNYSNKRVREAQGGKQFSLVCIMQFNMLRIRTPPSPTPTPTTALECNDSVLKPANCPETEF